MNENIQVVFRQDGYVEVRTTGPVPKESYAKIKPFLQEHFQYNSEGKCYEVYTTNPRFVNWLFEELRRAGFLAHQIGHFKNRNA